MNFATRRQDDNPRCDILRAELGAENAAGMPLVFGSGASERHQQAVEDGTCARMFFKIQFELPASLPIPALGHSHHFGVGLFVPVGEEKQ